MIYQFFCHAIMAKCVAGDVKTFFLLKVVSLYQAVLLGFVFLQ